MLDNFLKRGELLERERETETPERGREGQRYHCNNKELFLFYNNYYWNSINLK
jgi:hypothetical protein